MAARWSVVIVEDDREVRDLLVLLFELDGRFAPVVAAEDGRAGIDAVVEHRPDIVIVDLHLPEVAGPEVIRACRERAPETRVVVFSAFPDPFTLLEVLRLGADSYLDKATAWNELVPTAAELCALPADVTP